MSGVLAARLAHTGIVWTLYTSAIVGFSWLIHLPSLAILAVLAGKGVVTTSTYSLLHIRDRRRKPHHLRPSHLEFAIVMSSLVTFIGLAGFAIMQVKGG